jgi:DNA-binding NarL/FixJ family response regulator
MENWNICSILIVDDDRPMCLTLQKFLSEAGYDCRFTTDSPEALNMLKNIAFDLLISDINMPHMNGIELIRRIGIENRSIESIVMTGLHGDYTYGEIIGAGAKDFIRKPFELAELKAKIEKIERERKMLAKLEETNSALGIVIRRVEEDRDALKSDILANLKQLISPYLDKLKNTRLDEMQTALVDILDSNVSRIVSSFTTSLSQAHLNLSHTEIRIANLIHAGKDTKEIAKLLGVSLNTVKTHRYHLRTKLGLINGKVGLKSYLQSLQV